MTRPCLVIWFNDEEPINTLEPDSKDPIDTERLLVLSELSDIFCVPPADNKTLGSFIDCGHTDTDADDDGTSPCDLFNDAGLFGAFPSSPTSIDSSTATFVAG